MTQLKTGSDLIPSARLENGTLFASINGEINLYNTPDLRTTLLHLMQQHPIKNLALNLSHVAYVDSSAIAIFVELLQKTRKAGGLVYLIGIQPRVRGLLEIVRLDKLFKIVASESDIAA